ncbi:MAG: hypothetical protein QOI08_748, partial [Actinomycetota bacterium]|nr:hypothetical protein [Actinomycetota bacterium]
ECDHAQRDRVAAGFGAGEVTGEAGAGTAPVCAIRFCAGCFCAGGLPPRGRGDVGLGRGHTGKLGAPGGRASDGAVPVKGFPATTG